MRSTVVTAVLALVVFALIAVPALVGAQQYIPPNYPPPADMQQWLAATEHQNRISPGTTITSANWQSYKEEMSYGLQTLYSGKYFWKIPTDATITVGPTVILSQPKPYLTAGEQYGSQTSIGVTAIATFATMWPGPHFLTRFHKDQTHRKAIKFWPMITFRGCPTFTPSHLSIQV